MLAASEQSPPARRRLAVSGVVQGVGFRPFVYNLARRYGLKGFVGNESGGVFIEIEGPPDSLRAFQHALRAEAPPLAHIESVTTEQQPVRGETDFVIVHSQAQTGARTLISPDLNTCPDCLRELFDPDDRRYRYPFINCTNCGPRFTITRDVPYDRPLTTMAGFAMCALCQSEYDDPANRRFHAQPNACPACGPQLEFVKGESRAQRADALTAAQRELAAGRIVAVKGVGGFHLAGDAGSDAALSLLRARKGRVDKPFAVMVRDLAAARQLAEINDAEQALLTSRERPIVLLRKKADAPLTPLVAPGNNYVGVMLAYAPLHYVLLTPAAGVSVPGVLVMTSGNLSDEPIAIDNDEALARLSSLADAFLWHNRPIHVPCDDSVVRVCAGHELPVRRSRGYAPFPVKLPFPVAPTLAVGGELKNTFCLAQEDHAFMSQHIGDVENLETLEALAASVTQFQALFRVTPRIVVADRHPRYLSARWAADNFRRIGGDGGRLVEVQHHHAHIASVMAENGLDGAQPVIGFSFDGTGYGTDGAVWGGEVLLADYHGFRRAAHLAYIPLPGGDASVKRPYRVALAHLLAAGVPWDDALPPVAACPPVERKLLARQFATGFQCVPTSSCGRLFDAVAALAGVRQSVTYEAQAAIEMEALAREDVTGGYEFALTEQAAGGPAWTIEAAPVIRAVAQEVRAGAPPGLIAAKFHYAVAQLVLNLGQRLREATGLNQIALSGGVWQNVTLLTATVTRLREAGFEVLTHRLVPPNDGGLALGQAVIAHFQVHA